MSLYSTAVKKPITTALCFVAVVVIGLFSLTRLSIDLLPNIETNTIMVLTSYPGASASDIETNVTKIMENTLNTVSDLKDISSQSKENLSIVTLEFEYGTDIDVATNDVRDKIDMIRSTLPDNAGTPVLFKFGTDDIPIVILSVTAEESMPGLYKILDDKVANPLKRISGVGAVSISGAPEREIQVYCDPAKLEAYNLTVEAISSIIASENLNTPGGSFDIGSNTYSLRVQGEFSDPKQLNDIVVGSYNGSSIYLRDVARVVDTVKEREQEAYNNGQQGGYDCDPKTIWCKFCEYCQQRVEEVTGHTIRIAFGCEARYHHQYFHQYRKYYRQSCRDGFGNVCHRHAGRIGILGSLESYIHHHYYDPYIVDRLVLLSVDLGKYVEYHIVEFFEYSDRYGCRRCYRGA